MKIFSINFYFGYYFKKPYSRSIGEFLLFIKKEIR